MNLFENIGDVNLIEATKRIKELQSLLVEQSMNQKQQNMKIGFLESQIDDLNDNNQILEQENQALKDTNKFLKKLNLDIQSKHKRNMYQNMMTENQMGSKGMP